MNAIPVWRRVPRCVAALALAAVVAGCLHDSGGAPRYGVDRVFANLAFPGITDIRSATDGMGRERLFVVGKAGRIHAFDPAVAAPPASLWLDLTGDATLATAGEGGLLGLAFDPGYATNGHFYVHYTVRDANNDRQVVIARFQDDFTGPVDVTMREIVISVDYPDEFSNHSAGGIAFGPADGYLYLTMGDGGGGFDPHGNGQDVTTLLGAILRIDVAETGTGIDPNYDVPDDNPLVGAGSDARPEIFAWGMRNPFRISIERIGDDDQRVWVGDVGQNRREEINVVTSGGNYGWDCYEGTLTVPGASASCQSKSASDFEFPVVEYDHSQGFSVTGGHVYTGTRLPALIGRYVYGDFGSGNIWGYDPETGSNVLLAVSGLRITTFGTTADGALYVGDFGGGIYRLYR